MPRIPVPLRLTVCGLPLALSVTVSVPLKVPVPVGAKLTEMVQLAPAFKLDPQVLVTVYFELTVMLVIVTLEVPVLVRVTFWLGLVVLKICWLKVRLVGDRVTVELPRAKTGNSNKARTSRRPAPLIEPPQG